jgi:hypothetical protein
VKSREDNDQFTRHPAPPRKSIAAERGNPLRQLVAEALADKLRSHGDTDKPWMKSFGKLRHLHNETARINRIIDDEFDRIQPEDCD